MVLIWYLATAGFEAAGEVGAFKFDLSLGYLHGDCLFPDTSSTSLLHDWNSVASEIITAFVVVVIEILLQNSKEFPGVELFAPPGHHETPSKE